MYKRMTQGVLKDNDKWVKGDIEYVQRVSDGAMIPCVEENKDYLQYLADVEAGAVVEDFDYDAEDQRQEEALAITVAEREREQLIQAKMRELAIQALDAEAK